ncbi:MAG: 1-(5-phosphoribosyl)-5-[(5-phosphoribosylamino)methylideneamino]imidazole-4-carboxamide isomerase [Polyangiaceae bacterium]|nr:1-(5-phosphoribosyl)-5-[(5-phosphoribosylamino)methylideneamino]imidazole-4-carboxamide isomerase [Polyangiaceae bacterium]
MIVIPAIDLLHGKAVRLRRGDYDQVTYYERDPAEIASEWRRLVPRLHVVDLEGARAGRTAQRELVARIVAAFGPGVQVGGGLRDLPTIEATIDLGVERVVLGTAAIKDPALVRQAASRWPDRVIVAVDAKDGWVATEGWEQTSDRRVEDLVRELSGLPLGGLLYTDIERDGTEVGPNVEATARLAAQSEIPVIASGGVGTLAHLAALARAPGGIAAAIVGRALHEQRFSLAEAVAHSEPAGA